MKSAKLIIFLLLFLSLSVRAQISVYDERCDNLVNPLGIDNRSPHFSWKLTSSVQGDYQSAYQIEVASTRELLESDSPDVWDSGKTNSDKSVMVDYSGSALSDKQLCYWRVKVWDSLGNESAWSGIQQFSIGILDNKLQGKYITISELDGETKSPLVRKKINIDAMGLVFAHVNSLGYHELYVNGTKVTNNVLQPAVSQLNKRSLIVTYDITSFVKSGDNDIVLWLGEGWYRKNVFHTAEDGPMVKMEIDQNTGTGWNVVATTDNTWSVSPSGYFDTGRWDGLGFGGERVDGAKIPHTMSSAELDNRNWYSPRVVDVAGMTATPQMFAGNRVGERISPISITPNGDGSWLVDMGKVFTGWLQVRIPGLKVGDGFKVEYTDNIMPGGAFESQGESDTYSSCGDYEYDTFSNKFHHHVTRYALITPFEEALGGDVLAKGIAPKIFSTSQPEVKGLTITGVDEGGSTFTCNDDDINKIHNLIHHTVENLTFSGYMVDCAHLERQGYGGDGNSSTMTLQTMFDVSSTYYNWMQAWGDVMDSDGSLPYVAPAGGGGGGPYWSEFFVTAPWRTYLNYGDKRLLQKYYDQAKLWLSYVDKYSSANLLGVWPDNDTRVWWLGDWAAPDNVDVNSDATKMLVNNCVVSSAYQTMVQMAKVLGKTDDISGFNENISTVNSAINTKYVNKGTYIVGTGSPLDMSFAMLTGVVPSLPDSQLYKNVKKKMLMELNNKYNNHMATGLVGVPILTEWITKEGEANLMMDILKKRDCPSYLYMIDNGATGTWEYWDGKRSHMHNCYNGIGTWFYQALAGIILDENNPGYKHFYINPQMPDGITNVKVSKPSPYGIIRVEWNKHDNVVDYTIDIPVGATATLVSEGETKELLSGHHYISTTLNDINSIKDNANYDGPIYIYNLSGQRVENGYKGILIRNGRKEIRK